MLFSSLFRQSVLALCATTAITAAPSGSLINPKADSNAKALMAYLLKLYNSKQVLSGQQDPTSTAWVTSNIGKTPAITGFDMMDYSPSRVAYGSKSTSVEDALSWANRGGIVAFVWHWGSPSGTLNTASEPWYSNFYTAATSFDLSAAMANTNSNDYKLILRDIDAISTELLRLQSAGVPVLWRPLHEAEGGWFWWGAKGSGPCKALYALMYDRMTNYHGLNNLIWVWNSESSSWYPGNSAVDIVSTDLYPSAGDHNVQQAHYNTLKNLSGGTKIIAMAECGVIPDPAAMLSSGVQWAYWVVWNGAFITDGSHNSHSFLVSTYNSASVLTLDEIQGWKSGGGSSGGSGGGGSTPTTSKAGSTPTPTTPASGGSPLYGQCGGIGWTGSTTCAAGTCKYSSAYYSQCLN